MMIAQPAAAAQALDGHIFGVAQAPPHHFTWARPDADPGPNGLSDYFSQI